MRHRFRRESDYDNAVVLHYVLFFRSQLHAVLLRKISVDFDYASLLAATPRRHFARHGPLLYDESERKRAVCENAYHDIYYVPCARRIE